MPVTPQITLTANLENILGGGLTAGWMQITLCGFGPVLPCVPGTAMLANGGIPTLAGPQVSPGVPLSTLIYGNDVIQPDGTYYTVAILDSNQNVIQTGAYQFTGAGTQDLSEAIQMVPPYGFLPGLLQMHLCPGAIPGTTYLAPGPVVGVFYNGNCLRPGVDYNVSGNLITLTFSTVLGDSDVYALCLVQ